MYKKHCLYNLSVKAPMALFFSPIFLFLPIHAHAPFHLSLFTLSFEPSIRATFILSVRRRFSSLFGAANCHRIESPACLVYFSDLKKTQIPKMLSYKILPQQTPISRNIRRNLRNYESFGLIFFLKRMLRGLRLFSLDHGRGTEPWAGGNEAGRVY